VRRLRQRAAAYRAHYFNREEYVMSKRKTTKKKATAKTRKPAAKVQKKPEKKTAREDLCVFAFRLTAEERAAIHKAAGPAMASKFARGLLVAAARNDDAGVKAIMKVAHSKA
jgi:hypothetical protein